MKTIPLRTAAIALLSLAAVFHGAADTEGGASLSWNTLDGGGGLCDAAPYLLGGTAGQSDAASSSGGSYTLVGGFWAGAYAGPTPQPTVTFVNGKVQITWPSWATGFKLLCKPDLSPTTTWTLTPFAVALDGNRYVVEIPSGQANGFYQLWLP